MCDGSNHCAEVKDHGPATYGQAAYALVNTFPTPFMALHRVKPSEMQRDKSMCKGLLLKVGCVQI